MGVLTDRSRLLTTDELSEQAREVMGVLEGPEGSLHVQRGDGGDVPLPPELGKILQAVLDAIATGSAITISSVPDEVTTGTAASLLGVSRPTVMKMIEDGVLTSHKVGTHHRLKTTDVMQALRDRRKRQRAAFDALRDLDV